MLLIIFAGNDAWINRCILSCKPVVWIGLISYPLYLWHWPLIVFQKIIMGHSMGVLGRLGLIVISFFLAVITYLYVESYFKKN